MRYLKGSILNSPKRDVALLKLIWESEIVTVPQLFELLKLLDRGLCGSPRALANRLRGFNKHGLVTQRRLFIPGFTVGYTITTNAISLLRELGHVIEPAQEEHDLRPAAECLYLNDLRIQLGRQYVDYQWTSRRERKARRHWLEEASCDGDLAARVTIKVDWGLLRLGIVYAVPARSPSDHKRVQTRWIESRDIEWVIYVVSSVEEARWLVRQWPQCTIPTYFIPKKDLPEQLFDACAYPADGTAPSPLLSHIAKNLQPSLFLTSKKIPMDRCGMDRSNALATQED